MEIWIFFSLVILKCYLLVVNIILVKFIVENLKVCFFVLLVVIGVFVI